MKPPRPRQRGVTAPRALTLTRSVAAPGPVPGRRLNLIPYPLEFANCARGQIWLAATASQAPPGRCGGTCRAARGTCAVSGCRLGASRRWHPEVVPEPARAGRRDLVERPVLVSGLNAVVQVVGEADRAEGGGA